MSTPQLLQEAFAALVIPHRAFSRIPGDARINYRVVIPLMALWGVPYALLHFRAMDGLWIVSRGPEYWRWRVMTFVLGSLVNWLLATVAIASLSWLRRWPLSFTQCEIAAFYLWTVWALMPLVDVVHFFGVSRVNYSLLLPGGHRVSFIAHASWLFAFPVLCMELVVLFRRALRYSWLEGILLAIAMLLLSRGLLEVLSLRTQHQLAQRGLYPDMWQLNSFHAALGICQWSAVRVWLAGYLSLWLSFALAR